MGRVISVANAPAFGDKLQHVCCAETDEKDRIQKTEDRVLLAVCYNAALKVKKGGPQLCWGCSSVVEHLTADQEVPRPSLGAPYLTGTCTPLQLCLTLLQDTPDGNGGPVLHLAPSLVIPS